MRFKKIVSDKIGLDQTIAITILTRLIQAGGGVVSIYFIANYLNSDEQGYYYTFASILAIQVFFELGLSGIITQYVAHEFAHLEYDGSKILGNKHHSSRLSSLLRFCIKWFSLISCLLFFLLFGAGFYFFNKFNNSVTYINWQGPWLVMCLTTSLNLFIDPILAFFDGMGDIKDMAKVRFIQKLTMITLLFLFLVLGFKLYSAALASLVSILINYFQILFSKRFSKLKCIWKMLAESKIEYLTEIFPLQWKIALSWVSGYFIFQLFNPVLFATEGAKVAGQMGMTLQALNGISAISMSWITTKVPIFSSLIAEKKDVTLNTLFDKTVKQLGLVNFSLLIMLIMVILTLKYFDIKLAYRFLDQIPLLLLCVCTLVNQFIFAWATFLRCHKEEPFLINSLCVGIFCALSTFVLGKYFGLWGIVIGYSCITCLIALTLSYRIFINERRNKYHYS